KARTLSAAASRTPASLSPRSLTSVGTAFSTKKPFLSCRAASRRAAADSADSCRCNFRKPSSSSSARLAAGMAHKTAETIPRRKKVTWRRFMRGSSCWGPQCPSLLSHPTDRRAPRRMPDHNQHALDDNRLCHVQALVALAPGEADGAQHAGRASRLDEDATVNLIGGATGHEHEAAGAGLDANRVEVRHGGEIELGGDARCLAPLGTHRGRHHPGSRCPALVAAAVPQGPVVLHAEHTGRPHPPVVRLCRAGTGGRMRITTQRDGEEASFLLR